MRAYRIVRESPHPAGRIFGLSLDVEHHDDVAGVTVARRYEFGGVPHPDELVTMLEAEGARLLDEKIRESWAEIEFPRHAVAHREPPPPPAPVPAPPPSWWRRWWRTLTGQA
jgi:hypothetical protein